mgnify:CR=1 FL=1
MSPAIWVTLVHYQRPAEIFAALDSLANSALSCRAVVVDNDPATCPTAQIAARGAEVLAAGGNVGFAAAHNLGIARALAGGADFVFLLNDDARVEPATIGLLIAALRADPAAAFAGPKVLLRENPGVLLSAGMTLDRAGRSRQRGIGETDAGQWDAPAAVDALSGCALLARRAAIERIGPLDPRYFLYREDVDWCWRARRAGLRCLYVPAARAFHPDTRARDAGSPLLTYYLTRNSLLFARWHKLGLRAEADLLAGFARTWLSGSLRPRWREKQAQRAALLRGALDGLRGRSGAQ